MLGFSILLLPSSPQGTRFALLSHWRCGLRNFVGPPMGREVMDAQHLSNPMPELKAAAIAADLPMNEMFSADGHPRPECARVVNYLLSMDTRRLAELGERAHEMFLRMGVTFNVYGNEDGSERIFPFDPVPRIIPAATWSEIEAGLIQRVRALNAFLADIYGEGAILSDQHRAPRPDHRIVAIPARRGRHQTSAI